MVPRLGAIWTRVVLNRLIFPKFLSGWDPIYRLETPLDPSKVSPLESSVTGPTILIYLRYEKFLTFDHILDMVVMRWLLIDKRIVTGPLNS